MGEQFADDSGKRLLQEIADKLKSARVFHRNDRHILFVCGGPIEDDANTMRRRFLEWARTELPEFLLIRAETAFKETFFHGPPEPPNLSTFETVIAETADCVLLFLESEGSFAEVGVFSTERRISHKTLVVNDFRYQTKDSFANLGPVATITARSVFSPTVWVRFDGANADFRQVKERLLRLSNRIHRKSVPLKPFKAQNYADKLALLLELVRIFRAVTLTALKETMRLTFGSPSRKDLARLLSILVAARCIARQDDYFLFGRDAQTLLEFDNLNVEDLIGRVLHHYRQHHEEIYALATGNR